MKLHIPVSLFRLLLGTFMAIVPATVAYSYAAHENLIYIIEKADSGIYNDNLLDIFDYSDITIARNTASPSDYYAHGGGIYNYNGALALGRNGSITISDNKASSSSWEAYGGGICNLASSSSITATLTFSDNGNISISGNEASSTNAYGTYGGGICNYGFPSAPATITFCGNGNITISGNKASMSRHAAYGGGICNYGSYSATVTLTFSSNADISISGNSVTTSSSSRNVYGGGIYNNGTLTMDGNGIITISNNTASTPSSKAYGGGIYNAGTLTLDANGDITISYNTASATSFSGAYGGGICNYGSSSSVTATMTFSGNGDISISGNTASGYGGAIYNYYSSLTMNGNGDITIANNTASYSGGAIYNCYSTLTMDGNGDITIVNNTASPFGGAIYNYNSGTMTMNGNGNISISGNTTSGSGGAIYNTSTLTMNHNGDISISSNTITTRTSSSYGGAIYNTGTLTMDGNGDISISGNTASSSGGAIYNTSTLVMEGNGDISISDNTASGYGGAIFNFSILTLSNNGNITISTNAVSSSSSQAYGGGIYSNNGTVSITGNQSVTFRGNLQASDTSAVLNGIYAKSTIVTLAAPEAGRMDFYDPIVVSGLRLNVAKDEFGNYVASCGVIRLTGESTEEDLLAAYQRVGLNMDVTQEAITASRTSSTNGHTALHGGELQIVHQAILETNGLTAEGAGHATLRLVDGTLRSTAAITVESGSTLALAGVNTLTATTLDVQDGAALEFSLGRANETDAALALNATLNTGALDLHLIGADELSTGTYKLITLADASQYSMDSWTSDLVSVIGGSWERLIWQEGTLYYSTESIEVTDNETESITTGLVPLPIIIREGTALIQQEGAADLVMSYDSTTTDAGRLAAIENSTSFARINVGAPEGSVNVLEVAEGMTASTAALNGAGDLAKTGSGTLEITGAGDHSGTLTVQQGRISLTGDGQLSSGAIVLGSDASAFSLRRSAARSTDAPLIATDSGISLTQNDSSRTGSLSGHEPLSAQGTAIIGQAGQRAVADNVCISLENSRATFTLGNLDLNNTVVDVNAADGLILHDLRLDATSQVANRADVLAQMTGQNSLQLGGLVSITGNGQLSTEQLYGVELASTGSLTLGMDSDLLAAAGLTEGGVAELWLAGLQVADSATLTFEDVLQADGQKLAITIQAIDRATDGTRLHLAVAAVPEPATATLTLLALTALAARRKRLRLAC